MSSPYRHLCLASICALLLVASAFAAGDPDRTQFGHDIRVGAGEQGADLTCVNCSVYVAGQVSGDVTTLHGRVVLEGSGQVAGDVTTVMGDVRMDPATQIAGDLTVVGGRIRREQGSQVAGEITDMEGTGWAALILAVPLFFLGAVIALLVWLVQRNRRPTTVPARA